MRPFDDSLLQALHGFQYLFANPRPFSRYFMAKAPFIWKYEDGTLLFETASLAGLEIIQDSGTRVGRFGPHGASARSCSRQSVLGLHSCRLAPLPGDVG